MNMQAFGGLLGLLAGGAAAFSPDEAQAAPRPKYMEELVNKLKRGDYTPMDFGTISGGQLKKLQWVDPAFTEGPLKLSGKNEVCPETDRRERTFSRRPGRWPEQCFPWFPVKGFFE